MQWVRSRKGFDNIDALTGTLCFSLLHFYRFLLQSNDFRHLTEKSIFYRHLSTLFILCVTVQFNACTTRANKLRFPRWQSWFVPPQGFQFPIITNESFKHKKCFYHSVCWGGDGSLAGAVGFPLDMDNSAHPLWSSAACWSKTSHRLQTIFLEKSVIL